MSGQTMGKHANPITILQNLIKNGDTPSVQYVIFNADSIIYSYKNGLAKIRANQQVDEKTTYNAYSVTKTFTALAVLQLAEVGKIDLDNPVGYYLSDFPYGQQITVKNLMTHSSGIPNPIPLSWIHLREDHGSFDKHSFVKSVIPKNRKTKFRPNEKFAYSNIGYMFLAQIIEHVTSQSYESYVKENILNKFDPGELDFNISNPTLHAVGYQKRWSLMNAALGFFIDKDRFMDQAEGKWKPFKHFYVNDPAYGGLIGTPTGFVAYIRELLKDESNLLSDEYKKRLFTENLLLDGTPSGVCLSWFKGELKGKRYFRHAGGGGGYYIELRIYPEPGLGSVIMFNRSGMSDERFLDKVDTYFIDGYKSVNHSSTKILLTNKASL